MSLATTFCWVCYNNAAHKTTGQPAILSLFLFPSLHYSGFNQRPVPLEPPRVEGLTDFIAGNGKQSPSSQQEATIY